MTIEESYKILGLRADATESDVRSAYKRQIKKYHPDTYKGDKNVATEKTMQINQAYRILTFKEKPSPSPKNSKTQKKHKFFLIELFKKLKKLFSKKDKQKKEKSQKEKKVDKHTQKETKNNKKQQKQKENNNLENTVVAPELILMGILAIILIILVIWFLAAGKN